jgi:hypothetical protein
VAWSNPDYLQAAEWPVGAEVTDANHNTACGAGYVYFEMARYDAAIYDRDTRTGQIFVVNLDDPCSITDDLIVFWYEKGTFGADWPHLPKW